MVTVHSLLRDGSPQLTGTALVAGLGMSGLAAARWLHGHDLPFALSDGRPQYEKVAALAEELNIDPDFRHSEDVEAALANIGFIVASPGISLASPLLEAARERGLPVVGDIELFSRIAAASEVPVVAITGSNGKSTVTTWVGDVLEAAGYNVKVGGNIGVAALQLLPAHGEPQPDCYVLELSSFQLDTTFSLEPTVATVLNVSADHMDRYADFEAYVASKASVFGGNEKTIAIINADDPSVSLMSVPGTSLRFASERRMDVDYALDKHQGQVWLLRRSGPLLPAKELHLPGRHNQLNALVVSAIIDALPLTVDDEVLKTSLREFAGLPHRTQWISGALGLDWFNDSKATNVGATLAALAGMPGPLWLLAGGEGKDQDFSPLLAGIDGRTRGIALFGVDADKIAAAIGDAVPLAMHETLEDAVGWCAEQASPGDQVLLSPACASFDQFSGYVDRGEAFASLVGLLEQSGNECIGEANIGASDAAKADGKGDA